MIYSNLDENALEKWWTLSLLAGVGAKLPAKLWRDNPSLEITLDGVEGRAKKLLSAFCQLDSSKCFSELRADLDEEIDIVTLGADQYPKALEELEAPPLFLFVKGNIELLKNFGSAVVGTRRPDREAIRLTEMVVKRKLVRGHTIISGGAIGIDSAAHRFALENKGETIVVSPSGIRALTPRSNADLFEEVVKGGGCIISEYSPFSQPRKFHFHRRNAVLAALSHEVIIVRAAEKSGTLITARAAGKLGKPLYAIPGSPLDPLSKGSNNLLKEGRAQFFDFSKQNEGPKREVKTQKLEPTELAIYTLLTTPKSIDEITEEIGFEIQAREVLALLTMMELAGQIQKDSRIGRYRRS